MAIRVRFAAPDLAEAMAVEAITHPIGVIRSNEDNATSLGSKNQLYTVLCQWPDHRVAADIVSYMKGYKDPRMEKYFQKHTIGAGYDNYLGMRAGLSYGNESTGPKFSTIKVGTMDRTLWMSAAETTFNMAEAAMLHWNIGKESAKDLYNAAIKLSFEQWGAEGVEAYLNDNTSAQSNYTDPFNQGSVAAVSSITIKWEDGDDERSLERLITQKWIALWPLGQEAWSEYRRTGYPHFFPLMNGNGSNLPVANRIPFPPSEYIRNTVNVNEAVQKLGADNYETKVWWQRKDK